MGLIVLLVLLSLWCSTVAAGSSSAPNRISSEDDFGVLSEELVDAENFVTGAGAGAVGGVAQTANMNWRAISIAVREMVKECGVKRVSVHYDTLLNETLTCNAAAVEPTKALKRRILRTFLLSERELKHIAKKVGAGLSTSLQEKGLVSRRIFEPLCSAQLRLNDCGPAPSPGQSNYPEIAKATECETQLARDAGELIWIASQDLCKRNMTWLFEYLDSRPCTDQIRVAATSTLNRDRVEKVKEFSEHMKRFSNAQVRQVIKENPNDTWAEICFNSADFARVYESLWDVDSCEANGRRRTTEKTQRPFPIWLDTFKATREFWTEKCVHGPPPPKRVLAYAPRPRDFNWDPPPPTIRMEESFKPNSGVSSLTVLTPILGIFGVVFGLIKMCQAYKKSSAESTG